MNIFHKKILSFVERKARLQGVIIDVEQLSITSLQKVLFSGFLCYRGDNIVKVKNGSLKVNLKALLHKKVKISVILNDIEIDSRYISRQILRIPRMELRLVGALKNQEFKVVGNMHDNICFNFETTKSVDSREFFLKLINVSISKYQVFMQGGLLSDFASKIYDKTLLQLLFYYKHENRSAFPMFNAIFQNTDKILIHPTNITLSKEYLINCLLERNHLSKSYKSYSEIPKLIKGAVICTEDPAYGIHKGVCNYSMGMTLRKNINTKQLSIGGSSISQQLIKNALLNGERTICRKIEEGILTLLMENYYKVSKNDILELYLNMIEFAPGIYGIEDAGLYYFDKHCEELNALEVLVLTYIIPRPIHFHDALLHKSEQLRINLYHHITKFYSVLKEKRIISGNIELFSKIKFTPKFGVFVLQKVNPRKINKIIIHCSGTKEGQHISVADIDRYHRLNNGWDMIGYHYVVYVDGSIHVGRAEGVIGAHCIGENEKSIGICYIGGLDALGRAKNTINVAQEKSLIVLCKRICEEYPGITIHGHNEFSDKDCPCFDVKRWSDEVLG